MRSVKRHAADPRCTDEPKTHLVLVSPVTFTSHPHSLFPSQETFLVKAAQGIRLEHCSRCLVWTPCHKLCLWKTVALTFGPLLWVGRWTHLDLTTLHFPALDNHHVTHREISCFQPHKWHDCDLSFCTWLFLLTTSGSISQITRCHSDSWVVFPCVNA